MLYHTLLALSICQIVLFFYYLYKKRYDNVAILFVLIIATAMKIFAI